MTGPARSAPGPHDTAILNLIAGKQSLAAIYQAGGGRWNSLDVADVLHRYQLTINQGGSIVRADVPADRVLSAGLRSTNQKIRSTALRAEQMLIALSRELGAESARAQLRVLREGNAGGGR
ncbi:MAG TPA: hypothetical protein VHX38_02845 [Pseudonocardiaceae bacterium]|jgi:hypothetical protein|nr:hypothetical protein [Pseudonocardiaceae bacterium]